MIIIVFVMVLKKNTYILVIKTKVAVPFHQISAQFELLAFPIEIPGLARNWNQDSVEAEGRQKQSWFYQRVLVSAGNKQKQSLPKDKSALTPASRIQIETRSGFVQESDSFCVAKFSVNTFFQGDNDHDVSLIVQKIEQTCFFPTEN